MSEVLATAEFSSVIHNNEVCEEIVNGATKTAIRLPKQNFIIRLAALMLVLPPAI